MMRNWFKRGLVFIVAMAAVITFERWYFRETLEGIVLRVDSDERILLAQNLNLDESDLKKSYVEWFLGDYELIEITNIEGLEAGMHVSISYDGRNFSENALSVAAMDYEVLEVAFVVVDSSVPAVSQTHINSELAAIFPLEEGRLQIFGGRDSYAFVQRLEQVVENSESLQLYFHGNANTADETGEGFNLMYNIEGDSIVEFIQNFDADQGLGSDALLHSIIERKTVLKAPLEVGNFWSDSFTFEGKLFEAVTSISRVEKNTNGQLEIETHTVVEGIPGFAENRYEETRVFVEGSGMTQFVNSPRMGENELFTFGFSLVTEKMD